MIASPAELVRQLQREYFSDARSTFVEVEAEPFDHAIRLSGTVLDESTAARLLGNPPSESTERALARRTNTARHRTRLQLCHLSPCCRRRSARTCQ